MLTKILAITAFALLSSSSALAAPGGCHAISGTYVNQNIPCTVPALACVEAHLTGDHAGVNTVIITGFDPVTQVFSGTTSTVLENGAVITGTIVGTLATGSVTTSTGGTRQYAHATGTTVTDGAGNYTGQYCLGNAGGGQ